MEWLRFGQANSRMKLMDRAFEQGISWRIEDSYPASQVRLLKQTALWMDHYSLSKIEVREEGQVSGLEADRGRARVTVCGYGFLNLEAFKDIFGFAREVDTDLARLNLREDELAEEIDKIIRIRTLRAGVRLGKLKAS